VISVTRGTDVSPELNAAFEEIVIGAAHVDRVTRDHRPRRENP
jgi:hypothetical protein